jgi:hypothetical protein
LYTPLACAAVTTADVWAVVFSNKPIAASVIMANIDRFIIIIIFFFFAISGFS